MGSTRETKYSGNQRWMDKIYKVQQQEFPFVPLVGPKFLWDARATHTITVNGNLVTSWYDLYQNTQLYQYFGEDLSKAPTYEIISGMPTIAFNGINNYLSAYPIPESSPNYTLIVVATDLQQNLADIAGQILFAFDANTGSLAAQFINVMNQIALLVDNNDPLGVFLGSPPAQVIVFRISSNGTVAEGWVNGGTGSSGSVSVTGGLMYLQIGAYLGNNYLAGNIPWLAYYDTALSNSDLDTALNYVSSNFGITVTPVS